MVARNREARKEFDAEQEFRLVAWKFIKELEEKNLTIPEELRGKQYECVDTMLKPFESWNTGPNLTRKLTRGL